MTEILIRILNLVERFRTMQELTEVAVAAYGVMLVFGIMNCVLGYRLMRFWMMLGGFGAGCATAFLFSRAMGIEDRTTLLAAVALTGALLAVVAFLIYRLGVFLIGAGIGLSISIYVLHPTTSFVFFLCMLAGAALGALAVRFSKEIIIAGTSLVGGIFAGLSLSRLGKLPEMPYGLAMSVGFALVGLLIQFVTNRADREDIPEEEERPEKKEEEYDECDEEAYEEAYREMYGDQPVSHILKRKRKAASEDAAAIEETAEKPGSRRGENGEALVSHRNHGTEAEEIPASRRNRKARYAAASSGNSGEATAERPPRRKRAAPYPSGENVFVQLEKPSEKNREGGLSVPLQEWQEEPPEPTIVVRDRPGRRKTGGRK